MMYRFILSPFNFLFSNRAIAEISAEVNEKSLNQLILKYGDDHPDIFRVRSTPRKQ